MAQTWKEYTTITSPSHKKLYQNPNASLPDTAYEKEQMRIERRRRQQEELAEKRYTLSYGTKKEKEKYYSAMQSEMKAISDQYHEQKRLEREREQKEIQAVFEAEKQKELVAQEKAKEQQAKARAYDEENKRLYHEYMERKKTEKRAYEKDPLISDSFFDKFGRSYR